MANLMKWRHKKHRTILIAKGARYIVLRGDISSDADREALVKAVKDEFGRCDMLVNNAGVAPLKRIDLLEATEASFDRVLSINLKGPYFLTQMVAKWMIEQKKLFPGKKLPHCQYRLNVVLYEFACPRGVLYQQGGGQYDDYALRRPLSGIRDRRI